MPEQTKTVFDAGYGATFSLSGIAFTNGICILDKDSEKELIRNYIAQTGEPWTEAAYDEANPRHNPNPVAGSNAHIIVGVQTSSGTPLAASIIDGTFTKIAEQSNSGIDSATLVAAQEAVVKANAPIVPGPSKGK